MAGAVEKKKVKRNTDVEEFEVQSNWGGARRDMAAVRQKLGCDHDVSEFYSPPRVVKMARQLGMKGGVSLDLTVPASDGYVWDFSRNTLQRSGDADRQREATVVLDDFA